MSYIKQISEKKDVALAALCDSLQISRATLYRNTKNNTQPDCMNRPLQPNNAISDEQRREILDILHSESFIDSTPYEVFYTLLDEGRYIASIRTMCRILLEAGETKDRRNQRNHRDAVKPELIATECRIRTGNLKLENSLLSIQVF